MTVRANKTNQSYIKHHWKEDAHVAAEQIVKQRALRNTVHQEQLRLEISCRFVAGAEVWRLINAASPVTATNPGHVCTGARRATLMETPPVSTVPPALSRWTGRLHGPRLLLSNGLPGSDLLSRLARPRRRGGPGPEFGAAAHVQRLL